MTANYPPDSAASAAPIPQDSKRPASVTALAIIGIILGGLAVLCSPLGVIPLVVKFGPPNPVLDAMRDDVNLFAYTIISTAIGWVLGAVLLSGSIGALVLKEWGRLGMLIYAGVSLPMSVANFVLQFAWVQPKMKAAMASAGLENQPGAMIGQIFGYVIGVLVLIYLLCVLYFLTRPHVKGAFARAGGLHRHGGANW